MDGEDFMMPSPKRQRTNSLDKTPPNVMSMSTADVPKFTTEAAVIVNGNGEAHATEKEPTTDGNDQNEILDALMQHVESEVMPTESTTTNTEPATVTTKPVTQTSIPELTTTDNEPKDSQSKENTPQIAWKDAPAAKTTTDGPKVNNLTEEAQVASETPVVRGNKENTEEYEQSGYDMTDAQRAALQVDAIPPTEAIEPIDGEGEPEWEVDSSPYESSTDSDSTDSSSDDSDDDDEDADGDYAMLDPEEAARILMQGDAGSDDEGERSKNKGEGSGLRTANEQMEDVPLVPDITITEDMKIEELGSVEAIVENNVLIRGKVSGEYQVLEPGSLLCLQTRAIAGVVGDIFGQVREPQYTVRFRNEQEIKDRGLFEKGTTVYYVPEHSSVVFTQPLKAFKGSDASNFHDEEVGDEEMEFSDDEAEAEHKRQMKLKRQGRSGDSGRGRGAGRSGRGGQRGGYKPSPLSTDTNGAAYGNGSIEMNYDDVEEGEEGYTPLARPNNLHEMMNSSAFTEGSSATHMQPSHFADRGRGRGQHRGRGQDRNHRGGRGNFRGKPNNGNRGGSFQQNNQSPTQYQQPFANPFPYGQFPYSQPPAAPSLTPQNSAYPYATVTSPISPLPKSQFNFGAAFQAPQPHSPTFQQQQWTQQMPAGFVPQFNNPALLQFAQQFQQSQQQQQQQNGGWQVNQAAAAEVQRQLDEMRRARQQGGGGGGQQ